MRKPIIGIVAKNINYVDADGSWPYQATTSFARLGILDAGGVTLGILPTNYTTVFNDDDSGKNKDNLTKEEQKDLVSQLKLVDGILLQGGENSDFYEEFIARYCYDNDIPLLGICAGFNNIVRGLGGTTYNAIDKKLHLRSNAVKNAHEITIEKGSLLYSLVKREKMPVNSIHSWAAKDLEKLTASAYAPDGVIEAVEDKNKIFFLGLKFHPELDLNNPAYKDIFKGFVNKIKKTIS